MALLPHLLAHIMFMSRDPFGVCRTLTNLTIPLFAPLFTCTLYVLVYSFILFCTYMPDRVFSGMLRHI